MSIETDIRAQKNEAEIKAIWKQLNGGSPAEESPKGDLVEVVEDHAKKIEGIIEVVTTITEKLIEIKKTQEEIVSALTGNIVDRLGKLEKMPIVKAKAPRKKGKKKKNAKKDTPTVQAA